MPTTAATTTPAETDVSPARAAAILGVSRLLVMQYLRAGLLDAWDIAPPGSSRPTYRITVASLHAFKASRAVRPAAEATPSTAPARRRSPGRPHPTRSRHFGELHA